MPYKPLTHEAFHTGMSGAGNDSKWSDMRNIRSQGGKSVVTPPKVVIKRLSGLHTVAALGKVRNLAFGSHRSVIFKGSDAVNCEPLWRVTVRHNTSADDFPRGLCVRGCYTGQGEQLKVNYVDKQLITELPATPDPEPEAPFECYGCCDGAIRQITGTVLDQDGNPAAGAVVEIFQFGAIIQKIPANGGGIWVGLLFDGEYTMRIIYPDYPIHSIPLYVYADGPREDVLYMPDFGHYLKAGAKLEVLYEAAGGLYEPSTIVPAPTINGIELPQTSWEVLPDGDGLATYVLSYETLELIYAEQAPETDTYDFVVQNVYTWIAPESTVYSETGLVLFNNHGSTDFTFSLPET